MSEKIVALALGAGGARGLAHIHALMALDDLGIRPVALSGTSIGSIMAVAYGSGMSGADIQDFALEKFQVGPALLTDLWKIRAGSLREFFEETGIFIYPTEFS